MIFFKGGRGNYRPMPDNEEWAGTSQESIDIEGGDSILRTPQQLSANDVNVADSNVSIPSGNDELTNEVEVVVDDDSSRVMVSDPCVPSELKCILYCMNLFPTVKSSSAIRRRRYLIVACLVFIAMLLLAVVIAVPVASKMHVTRVKSFDTSLDRNDGIVSIDDERVRDDSKVGNNTLSINDEGIIVNEDSMTTPILETENVESTKTTSTSLVADGIDKNTGEEIFIDQSLEISTVATSPNFNDELQAATLIPTLTDSNFDENTGEAMYEEPFDSPTTTLANIASNANQYAAEGNGSNDASLSIMSTVDTISNQNHNAVTNDSGVNSIDDIISIHMSPSEESDRQSQWLKAHNTRRKQWHQDNDVTYVPLRWSTGLASSALTWAQELIKQDYETFELNHDHETDQGENLAKNCGTGSWSLMYPTDNILGRWVEEEIGLSPPHNLHLLQVLWRPTKFVGCADAMREYDNGRVCHVQVCRYAKAGNCNLGQYTDWMIPMLLDDSPCGPECPPEGC
jgi:uncharacterized protein YkwD